jgi:hypothetical protein
LAVQNSIVGFFSNPGILKKIDIRCGLDSTGLGQVLIVTCCELRDGLLFSPKIWNCFISHWLLSVSHEGLSTMASGSQSLLNKFLTGN